jgi:hypothetical protein
MTTHVHQQSVAKIPFWRRHQFWRVALPTVAIASAVVAGILVLNAFVGSNGVKQAKHWGVNYPTPKPPPTVKFTAAERAVVKKFVITAVARKNLDQAYAISGPGVREGMSLKQFMTGNIAVVPYVVDDTTIARMAIDQSYATSAQVEVYLSTAHQRGRIFFVDLVKKHGKWFVNAWVPRGSPLIPNHQ